MKRVFLVIALLLIPTGMTARLKRCSKKPCYSNIDCKKCCAQGRWASDECKQKCNRCQIYNDEAKLQFNDTSGPK